MILAVTTEAGSQEDAREAGCLTQFVLDSFGMRPSVEERAVRRLAYMACNNLAMLQTGSERPVRLDAAFVFVRHGQARFLISGESAAYHFEAGVLAHRSQPDTADRFGAGPSFQTRMEPVFSLRHSDNALLAASPSLAHTLTEEQIQQALQGAKTPEEWLERLKEQMGPDRPFNAAAAFVPGAGPSFLKSLLGRKQ